MPDNITLRTDNGPQYISKEFNSYLKTMGINHEYIEKETPEENGDIESFHNSIKTDYIWINEINNFSDSKIIIENAFYDYDKAIDFYREILHGNRYYGKISRRLAKMNHKNSL